MGVEAARATATSSSPAPTTATRVCPGARVHRRRWRLGCRGPARDRHEITGARRAPRDGPPAPAARHRSCEPQPASAASTRRARRWPPAARGRGAGDPRAATASSAAVRQAIPRPIAWHSRARCRSTAGVTLAPVWPEPCTSCSSPTTSRRRPTPRPRRTHEHTTRWVQAGHEVTVITGVPNFPSGKVHAGYRNSPGSRRPIDGMRVIRVWTYITANEGFLQAHARLRELHGHRRPRGAVRAAARRDRRHLAAVLHRAGRLPARRSSAAGRSCSSCATCGRTRSRPWAR